MATTETRAAGAPAALGAATMCGALSTTLAERPDAVALRTHDDQTRMTFAELGERIRAVAAGLAALGVQRGDAVGLMMLNRPEFHVVDAAAMLLGAVPFSVYNTSPPEQIGFVMGDAGNRVVICEPQFEPVIRAAREHGAGQLEHVVRLDELDELVARGDRDFDVEAAARAVEPNDLLTLIYTSGTTGPPKGVQITHANVLAELRGVHAAVPIRSGGRALSYLPSAHIADRWASHYSALMTYGATVTPVADLSQVIPVAAQVRPTFFGGVPRVWEKLKAALQAGGVEAKPELGPAVKQKLGFEEVEWFVTGAAPTPVELLEFFAALGIEICEVWGMSETTCIATTVRPGALRPGSVGTPIDGVEVRVDDDGELLVRGGTVMAGYRNRPDLTAEAIDPDGWLHTGDIARIDEDGYVWIVDRKKELIINAAGKNMSPANIEIQLKSAGPLIGQACVVGDRRPYNVALVVLDPETGLDPSDPDVLARVRQEVEAANAKLSRVEQVKRFTLLDEEWLPGGDELTPTMKLKRRPIAEKYAARIDELYA
ncbi:MAG TPA: AMP-dependent synthetase/ligase [Solirubrobacteraceae bacterium]